MRRCYVYTPIANMPKSTAVDRQALGEKRGLLQRGPHEVVSGVHGETRSNSPPELRSVCTKRSSLRAVPWTPPPVSMSSISTILPPPRPKLLLACTRNLPSQMNHDTTN